MKIREAGERLGEALLNLEYTLPVESILHRAALEVQGMASAYHSDGSTFLFRGDLINALAAYAYAIGWIESGLHLGIVSLEQKLTLPYFSERIPQTLQFQLEEKSLRYCRLLKRGLQGLDCVAECDTPLHGAALHGIRVAEAMVAQGLRYRSAGDEQNALACFSYGFAWLDAGVRIGLFRILQDRDLFTIG